MLNHRYGLNNAIYGSRGGSWTRHFSSKLQNSVTTVQLYQVLVLDLRSLSWNMDGET